MVKESIRNLLNGLPDGPGVYEFLDETAKIIYVGKARNLKKRVSSYFSKQHDNAKTRVLVSRIESIRHIVTPTEFEALLLENNLIKEYQPRYNINLKDDKTYPWICITREEFPRVFYTRNREHSDASYYGPFPSVKTVRALLDLSRQLFQPRNCLLPLNEEGIRAKKFKSCLEFQIGNCLAPCIDLQSGEDYRQKMEQIRKLVKGNFGGVLENLRREMYIQAEEFRFEKAHELKLRIELLEQYQSKSVVVSSSLSQLDVFSYLESEKGPIIHYFKVMNGAIIHSYSSSVKRKLDETREEILSYAVFRLRERFQSDSNEIIVPFPIDFPVTGLKLTVPQKGDKKRLLDLSEENARACLAEFERQWQAEERKKGTNRVLLVLQKALMLKEIPMHLECFDNSNLQGSSPVASCVVFRNGRPSKKDYRHFNIRTVSGPDDFASMEEIVSRRYRRMKDEGSDLPQLIVIDGGKGQLNAARTALEKLGLSGQIAIIGIAKRLEEIYFPDDPVPKYLDKRSEALKLIQQMRNEAHRFGIQFHRLKRSKAFIQSELDHVDGLGPKSKDLLFRKFGSVEGMRKASFDELVEALGNSRARRLFDFFRSQEANS